MSPLAKTFSNVNGQDAWCVPTDFMWYSLSFFTRCVNSDANASLIVDS